MLNKHTLAPDKLNLIIKRLTALLRIILIICISLSIASLVTIIITGAQFDGGSDTFTYLDGIAIISVFAGFYSLCYGTFPAMFVLIAIYFHNRLNKNDSFQPIKTEAKLLILNMIIVLMAGSVMAFKYYTLLE